MQNPVARQPAQVLCFLLSRLELTLIRHLANVDSKRLTEKLSSLQSALTKYRGVRGCCASSTLGGQTFGCPRVFSIYLFCFQAIAHSFAPRAPCNSFGINSLRTLSDIMGVWGVSFPYPQHALARSCGAFRVTD